MTQYSSGKHEKVNADRFPDVIDGARYGGVGEGGGWPESGENAGHWVELGGKITFAPRPEFDRPLTNPANDVLKLFRMQRFPQLPIRAHAQGFLNGINRLASEGFTINEITHARLVLTRLANLTPKE